MNYEENDKKIVEEYGRVGKEIIKILQNDKNVEDKK